MSNYRWKYHLQYCPPQCHLLLYLTRMAAKGLVSMDQSSPRRYAAIPSRETCAARERRDLVNRVYDGSAGQLVAAFVKDGSLSPQEREELRRLLDEMEV